MDKPKPKISLTIDERLKLRSDIDLTLYGFEKLSGFEYKSTQFYHVMLGDWCAVFTNKQFTIPVEYDKLKDFLKQHGYKKKSSKIR